MPLSKIFLKETPLEETPLEGTPPEGTSLEGTPLEGTPLESHYSEVAWWEIFMEQELRFGLDLGRFGNF